MNKKLINVKNKLKITSVTLALVMGLSTVTPGVTVFASELKQESQTSLWDIEEETNTNYDEKEAQAVIQITDTDLIINGKAYNSDKLESLLETAQEVDQASNGGRQKRFAAAAGVYFIPGVGQVALMATGAIVLGGVTIGAGHWAYKTIKNWLNNPQNSVSRAYGIPKSLLDGNGNVKLGNFNQKVGGRSAWKDPKTGYTKEKDTAGHAGKKWKIKDKKGARKASTDGNGKIISK